MKNAKTLPGADINSDHALLIGELDIRLKKIRGRQVTKKFDKEKLKNEEERRKFQEIFKNMTLTEKPHLTIATNIGFI